MNDEIDPDKELQEKDFIDNSMPKNPYFLMLWGLAFISIVTIFWGTGSWYHRTIDKKIEESPFLQVTNRELSVFLWYFSENMPQHVKDKLGYLPGFEYQNRIGLKLEVANEFCEAPPEVLFMYHTWDRLLRSEFSPRPIPKAQFLEFLDNQPEWGVDGWVKAPAAYLHFLELLGESNVEDLSSEPDASLPRMVRQAFQGWKNYKYEGDEINALKLKYSELQSFMRKSPHYTRNYWKNILSKSMPNYLLDFTYSEFDGSEFVPQEEIAPFLKAAVFNFLQAQKGR